MTSSPTRRPARGNPSRPWRQRRSTAGPDSSAWCALAVARAALREPGLPVARLDGPEREVRLDHRQDLVAERTRITGRLRWHLHELDHACGPRRRSLDRTRPWTPSTPAW